MKVCKIESLFINWFGVCVFFLKSEVILLCSDYFFLHRLICKPHLSVALSVK